MDDDKVPLQPQSCGAAWFATEDGMHVRISAGGVLGCELMRTVMECCCSCDGVGVGDANANPHQWQCSVAPVLPVPVTHLLWVREWLAQWVDDPTLRSWCRSIAAAPPLVADSQWDMFHCPHQWCRDFLEHLWSSPEFWPFYVSVLKLDIGSLQTALHLFMAVKLYGGGAEADWNQRMCHHHK